MNSNTKKFGLLLLLGLLLAGCAWQEKPIAQPAVQVETARTIVDMAGRSVTIPVKVNKVYGTSATGTILLYTIDPDLLVGWNYHMGMDGAQFVADKYKNLPVLGGWFGKSTTANMEDLMKIKPDLIITVDNLAKPELADQIQEATGIPVIALDGSINKMEEVYRFAGNVLGREDRTNVLAEYCHETAELVREKKLQLTGRNPVRVYYAEGGKGLETEPRGSWHTEVIEFVGGVNAAGVDLPKGSDIGRSPVSFEQVLLWNPEVIVIGYFRDGESSSYAQINTNADWKDIEAVRNHRVYEIPTQPFNWFDRPPCINRLIGIRWMANLLYPDVFALDIKAEVKRFYSLFYHYSLSEKEADELLQRVK